MSSTVKIVMIDDEPDLCAIVKMNLEENGGFQVSICNDPKTAEEFVKQEQPNLILLDVVMPQRKGSDIVAALRKDNATKKIPIIIVSGKGEMVFNKKNEQFVWEPNSKLVESRGDMPEAKGAQALAEAYGVEDYISKPFTTDLLQQIIQDVVARFKPKETSDDEKPV